MNYGDDMDEFNGLGRGRGRYYQIAWALKKMNMLFCAVFCPFVLLDFMLSFAFADHY